MKLGNVRNWSMQRVLWLCFLPLVIAMALMALIFGLQINALDRDETQIIDVQNPLEVTVLEMRISAGDIERAVLDYVRDRNATYVSMVRESEDNFARSVESFDKLVDTNEEKRVQEEIARLYGETEGYPDEIILLVDQQYLALSLFREQVEVTNDLIDETLRATTDITSLDAVAKLNGALDMAGSLDNISRAIESYLSIRYDTLQQDMLNAQASFEQAVANYRETTMSDFENRWLTHVNESFDEALTDGWEVIVITDSLQGLIDQFEESIGETASYLENMAQPLLSAETATTVVPARASTTTAYVSLVILIVLGIAAGGASILVLSRMIVNPIRGFIKGAEIVDSGRLDYKFDVDAKGEFGQLAFGLNRMLENLKRVKRILGESEETAWQILDSITESMVLIDRRGFIVASNELAAERYGMSLEQMIDTNFYDLLPEDQESSRKAQIADVIDTGKPAHFEDEREGMIIDHRIYPVHGARAEDLRLAIFTHDVTTHKWVEEVTRQLGRRNELILDAAGEGIYGLDTEGRTTFVNPAAARMLGYKPGDLIGQLHHELVHHSKPDGSTYPQSRCPIYAAFKDGTTRTSVDDEVFWRKDGTSFQVEYTSTPVIDKGNIVGAVVTFRDISERKWMEDILHKSEERYRSVFESAANLIISVDSQGIISDCNNRSQAILGYAPEDIVGKGLLDLIHPDDREKAQVSLDEVLSKGFDYHKRYRMIHQDGTEVDVQMNAAVAQDASGKYVRTICMIDTTEHGQR